MSKYTGLPSAAAASTRIGTSVRPGYTPVHSARASAKIGGIHCGTTGEYRAIGRPASVNSVVQSTEAAAAALDAAGEVSICPGTARKLTRRPVRSSVSDTIPERVAGGFAG